MYITFVLQLQEIKHLEDHGSAGHLNISNETIGFIIHNFTSIVRDIQKSWLPNISYSITCSKMQMKL